LGPRGTSQSPLSQTLTGSAWGAPGARLWTQTSRALLLTRARRTLNGCGAPGGGELDESTEALGPMLEMAGEARAGVSVSR